MHRIFYQIAHLCLLMTVTVAAAESGSSPIQYLSPTPSSTRVAPEAVLIIRFNNVEPTAVANLDKFVTVRGSTSGSTEGTISVASDERTIIFIPSTPFVAGENVSVRIRALVTGFETTIDSSYAFQISDEALPNGSSFESEPLPDDAVFHQLTEEVASYPSFSDGDPTVLNGVSVPSDFPSMRVLDSSDPAPGYLFLNNWGGQPYNMILDNTGAPVWYWRTPDRRRDFKVQPNGWLTMLVRKGNGEADGHIALDSTYSVVDTMQASGGYATDEHELTMLSDGHYFLIGRRESQVDMSRIVLGGRTDAIVRETVIQEFTSEDDLIFVWRSWDHYDIRDLELDNLLGGYIRFPHMNAISIDDDGHILVSSRHLSEVTKINRDTGDIIWRLGGAHNQFTWVNDPLEGFKSQHDIRALGGNRYTVFDNGNRHAPPETRALEFELDTSAMTATLVWDYRHEPPRYTHWMGNAQRLPNGNTQINYADASLPKIVEVKPDGTKALEMDFVRRANTYRAFKFDWTGKAKRPYLLAENSSTKVTLLFNKFGDPDIDHYNVYGGLTPNPEEIIATSEAPFVHLFSLANQTRHHFRVTAVNSIGEESDHSNEVNVFVNRIESGDNLVLNGDFGRSVRDWELEVTGAARAFVSSREDETLRFVISEPGTELWHVQLRQRGLPLITGRRYRFEYDAHAVQPRLFEAKITKDGDPWTNYGRIGLTSLSTRRAHFVHDFVMEDPTDFASRVVLNAGGNAADVFVDDVSLKEVSTTTSSLEEGQPDQAIVLYPNFPNPFSKETHIRYELPAANRVTLRVFNVMGQEVKVLVDRQQAPGSHAARFNATGLPSGIYHYVLEVTGTNGAVSKKGQMVYIRR